jgi:Ca2+-transporting ATPase
VAVVARDIVPADARVLAALGLRADESTLTGEAEPAGKSEQPVPAATGLAERTSLLHAGTAVVAGEGTGVVVATGPATELGKLGRLAADTREPPTPLQQAMSQLAARCWWRRSLPASWCPRWAWPPGSRSGTCCSPT